MADNNNNGYNNSYSSGRNQKGNDDKVRFELMEHIGVLAEKNSGWKKEVNIVAWNGGPAKVDVREWDPDHARMSKGITLLEQEAEELAKHLCKRYGIQGQTDAPADGESQDTAFAPA